MTAQFLDQTKLMELVNANNNVFGSLDRLEMIIIS